MAPTVRVMAPDGLRVVSPTQPEFDALARPWLGRVADLALELKPMLVLVTNEAEDTVVSFSTIWRITHRDGYTTTSRCHASFPHAVCRDFLNRPHEAPLTPGTTRLEANGLVIHGWGDGDPYYDQFLPQFITEKEALLREAAELVIDVNAAIFADGTLVGSDDESWLEQLFSSCIAAKQRWYGEVIAALDEGASVQDAFAPVERFVSEASEQRRSGHRRLSDTFADIWTEIAAQDAALWQHQHAKDDIPRLLRTIRLEPFVIRRR